MVLVDRVTAPMSVRDRILALQARALQWRRYVAERVVGRLWARACSVLVTGRAQGTFEYVILIVAVALLISGLIFKFGHGIGNTFKQSTTCLSNATASGFAGNSGFAKC